MLRRRAIRDGAVRQSNRHSAVGPPRPVSDPALVQIEVSDRLRWGAQLVEVIDGHGEDRSEAVRGSPLRPRSHHRPPRLNNAWLRERATTLEAGSTLDEAAEPNLKGRPALKAADERTPN
jgi:hypothetical protein